MSNPLQVRRRTFEAKKHPAGSAERATLNRDPLTSEYQPSYKYALVEANGMTTPYAYRTKAEAEAAALHLR